VVHADAVSDEPLELLAQASRSVGEIEAVGDALLDHFVESCRSAGFSWTEISGALGVSKQAAHKRFTAPAAAPTFERFTQRARGVLTGAVEEARALGAPSVGTEHLFLALYQQPEGLAAQVLNEIPLGRDAVVATMAELAGGAAGGPPIRGDIGYSRRARQVLRHAVEEALTLGHNYIGTEHLLLALFVDPDALAARVLANRGVSYGDVKRRLMAKFAATLQARSVVDGTPTSAEASPPEKPGEPK
jgi:Clp amino terminal domain, pathogenicity island component